MVNLTRFFRFPHHWLRGLRPSRQLRGFVYRSVHLVIIVSLSLPNLTGLTGAASTAEVDHGQGVSRHASKAMIRRAGGNQAIAGENGGETMLATTGDDANRGQSRITRSGENRTVLAAPHLQVTEYIDFNLVPTYGDTAIHKLPGDPQTDTYIGFDRCGREPGDGEGRRGVCDQVYL